MEQLAQGKLGFQPLLLLLGAHYGTVPFNLLMLQSNLLWKNKTHLHFPVTRRGGLSFGITSEANAFENEELDSSVAFGEN